MDAIQMGVDKPIRRPYLLIIYLRRFSYELNPIGDRKKGAGRK